MDCTNSFQAVELFLAMQGLVAKRAQAGLVPVLKPCKGHLHTHGLQSSVYP